MIVPNDKEDILKHLQGKWTKDIQYGGTVSFIIDGQRITNIQSDKYAIDETDFALRFNSDNLKWQLTSPVFGIDSTLINFESNSFTILIKNGTDIVPPIKITESFHSSVHFYKNRK